MSKAGGVQACKANAQNTIPAIHASYFLGTASNLCVILRSDSTRHPIMFTARQRAPIQLISDAPFPGSHTEPELRDWSFGASLSIQHLVFDRIYPNPMYPR